ncbi:MazG family protein [Allonocardiopsis opalescens]|uniref:XTP/dITP diphosphohydrolase n=1 Tax=Allonocardiopsis opalescens TaxID=1144618 RepID=A0A2T0QD24_9ACTN|nr:MazG family protein [Allonocardiopsis opalescens]PRY01856.1 XTP/dITP diphosphohydrolase [Allonocardiopsis opalescens]
MAAEPDPPAGGERPGAGEVPGARLLDLVATMDRLRRECPWTAGKTHRTLARFLIEEAYETLDAIEGGDPDELREELGDVLLQVVFHARIAAERPGGFTIDDVAAALNDKLVRRHPHVFAGAEVGGLEDIRANWNRIKAEERAAKRLAAPDGGAEPSVLAGVPFGQPAAQLSAELAKRAEAAGVPPEVMADDGEPGGRLFAAVLAERGRGGDPETDLRAAARRFDRRVRAAEAKARAEGLDPRSLSPEQWRAYWD